MTSPTQLQPRSILFPILALPLICAMLGCPTGPNNDMPPASIETPPQASDGGVGETDKANPNAARQNPVTSPPQIQPGADIDGGAKPLVDAADDELFAGWPKPKLAMFFTGQQHGYIEPCGCTGLANQKGGLARRHTLMRQLEDKLAGKGWNVVAMDVGNQVGRYGAQAEIKLQVTADGLHAMNYRAVALGPDDLRLRPDTLIALAAGSPDRPSPFVSANVAILDESLTPRLQILETPAGKIGVTSVLGTEEQKQVQSEDILLKLPAAGLGEVWPQLEAAGCDLYVLLAHASLDESRALARQYPGFDLVVTAGGAGEPTYEAEQLQGTDAVMVQVGTKGMYTSVVGWLDDGSLKYQRVPLDARFADSQTMRDLMASYQKTLQQRGLAGLEIRPITHPSGNQFVGSAKCAECHDAEYDIWKNSPHAHATESLVHPGERSDIARHFDPECLSCHVTGWNPQKFFPYTSGYLDLEKSAHLHGSGCENCHGPGSAHVAAENGDTALDDAAIEQLRAAMRLPLERAEQKCMDCHDLDNSPDFHQAGAFQRYWERIAH
ncbi:MAG: multiheme c-type cytochrome [Pirellulaceae bacterium]